MVISCLYWLLRQLLGLVVLRSRSQAANVWVPEIRSLIDDQVRRRYPGLLAAVDDRSRHRRAAGTRGVPCLVWHDLVFARAGNKRSRKR